MILWFLYCVGGVISVLISDYVMPVEGMSMTVKMIKAVIIGFIVGTILYRYNRWDK